MSNLIPGGKPHRKTKYSNALAIDLVHMLNRDYKGFVEHMRALSPKDYVETYLKLLKLVMPRNINHKVPGETENPIWTIVPASSVELPRNNE